ncbi:hypothetical protein TorRG33x02_125880, partial [Trema orientale]
MAFENVVLKQIRTDAPFRVFLGEDLTLSKFHGAKEISGAITSYMEFGQFNLAERLFLVMLMHKVASSTGLITSCSNNYHTEEWVPLFHQMIRSGVELIPSILSSILPEIPSQDFIYWYSMISGYAKLTASCEVPNLFNEIISQGTKPDWFNCGEALST